jgi:hypothetical protein
MFLKISPRTPTDPLFSWKTANIDTSHTFSFFTVCSPLSSSHGLSNQQLFRIFSSFLRVKCVAFPCFQWWRWSSWCDRRIARVNLSSFQRSEGKSASLVWWNNYTCHFSLTSRATSATLGDRQEEIRKRPVSTLAVLLGKTGLGSV